MQNLNKQFQGFLKDFILGAPEILKEIEIKLRAKYPDADDYWVNYWVARIAFFTNGKTEFNIRFIGDYGTMDPDTITLSFDPDYGS